MISDLYLVLSQKAALMQAVAIEPTTDGYLKAKSTFVAVPMKTPSAFGKPVKNKTKNTKDKAANRLITNGSSSVSTNQTEVGQEPQEDKKLFERLRQLRLQIAKEENVRAFIVFSDKTLHELATYNPTTLLAFEQVNGVGKKKIESYGERFVRSICEYLGQSYSPQQDNLIASNSGQSYARMQMDKHENSDAKLKLKKESKSSTYELTFLLYKEGNTPEQIAEIRGLTLGTIFNHLTRYVEKGQISIRDLVPRDMIDKVLETQTNHPNFTTMKEFFEAMDESVPYHYIRLVLEDPQQLK